MQLTSTALLQMQKVVKGYASSPNSREEIASDRRNRKDLKNTYCIENDINALRNRLKSENIAAFNHHEYDYTLGTIYIDIIMECEKLGDYVVNVVQARLVKK